MTTSFKKLDHINIVVGNIEEAKNFFMHFGFISKREGVLEGDWIDTATNLNGVNAHYVGMQLPNTETILELIQFDSPKGERDPKINSLNQIGFRHVAFQVENIEHVVAELKTKGVHFLSEIQTYEKLNKKLCYCEGPEGIILELAEYQ